MNETDKYIELYEQASKAKTYIRGFEYCGKIYYYFTDLKSLEYRVRATRVSSRHGKDDDRNLRLYKMSTSEKKQAIYELGAQVVCSLEFFQQVSKEKRFNRGETFEQVIRMHFDLENMKRGDKRGFWECGDIELNGEQIQVKYDDASLSAYKTIRKACGLE